jgi:hypothetical protein
VTDKSESLNASLRIGHVGKHLNDNVLSTPVLAPITTVSTGTSTEISMVTGRISYKFGGYGYGGGPAKVTQLHPL